MDYSRTINYKFTNKSIRVMKVTKGTRTKMSWGKWKKMEMILPQKNPNNLIDATWSHICNPLIYIMSIIDKMG